MRVLILGFDGLECDLVERYRLSGLKQRQYGKLEIPRECYKETIDPLGNRIYEPWTPFVWSSILTGRLPAEIGLTEENVQRWENPVIQLLRRLSLRLRLNTRKLTMFVRGQGMKLERIGFRKRWFNLLEDSNMPTIFHHAKRPISINVPLVRQKRIPHKETWRLKLRGESLEEIVKYAWDDFRRIRRRTLDAIKNEDWDLLMSYVRFLDTIGELRYGDPIEMMKAYFACDSYVREISKLIGDGTVLLVVSDHGIKPMGRGKYGMHSDHAFYSLNMETDWRPKSILDLYPKIREWLGG